MNENRLRKVSATTLAVWKAIAEAGEKGLLRGEVAKLGPPNTIAGSLITTKNYVSRKAEFNERTGRTTTRLFAKPELLQRLRAEEKRAATLPPVRQTVPVLLQEAWEAAVGEAATVTVEALAKRVAALEAAFAVFQEDSMRLLEAVTKPEAAWPLPPEEEEAAPEAASPPPKRGPRILIAGLINGQAAMIQREFPALDLHFVNAGERGDRVSALAQQCDRVLMMRKFVSHSMQDLLKPAAGERFHIVNGGMTELRAALEQAAAEAAEDTSRVN